MFGKDVCQIGTEWIGPIVIDYETDFDFHYNIFDEKRLTKLLVDAGFSYVSRYNWWEVEPHNYCDDFSQAYIPAQHRTIALSHGRVIEGDAILMSLNIEAVK